MTSVDPAEDFARVGKIFRWAAGLSAAAYSSSAVPSVEPAEDFAKVGKIFQ